MSLNKNISVEYLINLVNEKNTDRLETVDELLNELTHYKENFKRDTQNIDSLSQILEDENTDQFDLNDNYSLKKITNNKNTIKKLSFLTISIPILLSLISIAQDYLNDIQDDSYNQKLLLEERQQTISLKELVKINKSK